MLEYFHLMGAVGPLRMNTFPKDPQGLTCLSPLSSSDRQIPSWHVISCSGQGLSLLFLGSQMLYVLVSHWRRASLGLATPPRDRAIVALWFRRTFRAWSPAKGSLWEVCEELPVLEERSDLVGFNSVCFSPQRTDWDIRKNSVHTFEDLGPQPARLLGSH